LEGGGVVEVHASVLGSQFAVQQSAIVCSSIE
jgi:hypothetical protein